MFPNTEDPHLEDTKGFSVSDSLRRAAVDGEDTVALLDAAVAVRQSARNDLVNLKTEAKFSRSTSVDRVY